MIHKRESYSKNALFRRIYQRLYKKRQRRGLSNETTYEDSKIEFQKYYGYDNPLGKLQTEPQPPPDQRLIEDPIFKVLHELTTDTELKKRKSSRVVDTIF